MNGEFVNANVCARANSICKWNSTSNSCDTPDVNQLCDVLGLSEKACKDSTNQSEACYFIIADYRCVTMNDILMGSV